MFKIPAQLEVLLEMVNGAANLPFLLVKMPSSRWAASRFGLASEHFQGDDGAIVIHGA